MIDTPEYWNARAIEAWTIAEALTNHDTKRIMHEVAKGYELLARRAGERERQHAEHGREGK